jgi:uncharacterized protein (TIGR00369 family)
MTANNHMPMSRPDHPAQPSTAASGKHPAVVKRRSAAEQARFEQAMLQLCEQQISFNKLLGLRLARIEGSSIDVVFDMRPDLVGHFLYGRLHGGVISAVLDVTGGIALMAAIGEKHADESAEQVMHRFGRMATIDLRVDYLRPGIGAHFKATADVTRLGGRIASTQMKLAGEQGTVIATGAAAYVIS